MSNSCETSNKPKNIKELVKSKKFYKPFLGVLIGALAGFLYYHFVGCSSGTCGITSNPYSSIMMGGVLGFFITNSPCSTC